MSVPPRRPRTRVPDPNAQTRDADMIDQTLDELHPQETGLPFVKSSLLWTMIESMEAFCMMPQQPHFKPLMQYCVEQREGMAIGHMVNFANLVESTYKSQLEEPRVLFERRLSTLDDLKLHGFDVQRVQSRLENLLRIKDQQVQISRNMSMVIGKIEEKMREIDKFDTQIEGIEAQIKIKSYELTELEQFRSIYDKRIESVLAKIAKVQEEAQRTQHDFICIATAPW